jgi:mono/diheme cytochrome c family protein
MAGNAPVAGAFAVLLGAVALLDAAGGADGIPAPAVYSAAQARSGAAVYARYCSDCHGAALDGVAGPALKGPALHQMAAAQGLTGESLLTVVAESMPQSEPGSLTSLQYAAVVAYLLQENGYPAGEHDLAFGDPNLKLVNLAK